MKKVLLGLILSISSIIFCMVFDTLTSSLLAEEELETIEAKDGFKEKSRNKTQDDYNVILSTEFNFSETSIQGNMKTPDGFYIQGKKSQSLEEMVKLRSSFKRELLDSLYGVESVVR